MFVKKADFSNRISWAGRDAERACLEARLLGRLRNTRVTEATLVEQRKVMKITPKTLFWGSAFGSALTFIIGGRLQNFSPKRKSGLSV